MITSIKRIFRAGFLNFWRNGFVSLAAVLVMTITLFVIGSLIFFSALMNTTLAGIKSKVDINVYFVTAAPESDILNIKKSLEALPEVASVTYTSRADALTNFKDRHSKDYLTLQALDELGTNPLGASLNIKAKDTSQYESISKFLEGSDALVSGDTGGGQGGQGGLGQDKIIDKVNYNQNKAAIDKLSNIITGVQKIGFALTLILVAISIVITFNTIRLAIYTTREEISVMRLVGASNKYIRGPFVVEGAMYGVISALITLLAFWPLTVWLGHATEKFFGGMNVAVYYRQNFGEIFLVIMSAGIVLGTVSSFLAVRRYISRKYLKL